MVAKWTFAVRFHAEERDFNHSTPSLHKLTDRKKRNIHFSNFTCHDSTLYFIEVLPEILVCI